MRTLAKHCEPDTYEGRIMQKWLRDHSFHADTDPKKIPYTVILPPPDAAVPMHLGQAFSMTVQDLLIRRQRMAGCSALWLPCTDSAASSAEAEEIHALSGAGTSKNAVGREAFSAQTRERAEHHAAAYQQQMLKLGCSCDWERIRHTTDEAFADAVREAFVQRYEDGYLYRGDCIAEWCPKCRAALPEAEIQRTTEEGECCQLRYPFADGTGYLFLTTAHPETVFADTAVAFNPKDRRYQNIIKKSVIVPLTDRKIPVLTDDAVSMDSGTGIQRVTPACDAKGYAAAKQRKLPVIGLLTADASVSAEHGAYAGMPWEQACEAIRKDLKAGGFLVKSEPAVIEKAVCRRCGTEIVPHLRKQWFLRTKDFAEAAADAVKEGRIRFQPENAAECCLAYLSEAPDQCISRPAWNGIPVPAFHCDACGEISVNGAGAAECPKCGKPMQPDPDTLDTGFAASLLPFALLGYPERTDDLQYFYPTDAVITGSDLLTPFVSGMLAAAMQHMENEIPFKQVILHGLMRDASGQKITPARGNGLDPIALIDDYGADALRFAMLSGASVGKDTVLYESQVISAKRLAEKLWNCAQFVLGSLSGSFRYEGLPVRLHIEEQWILSRLNQLAGDVNAAIDDGTYGKAAALLGKFIRQTFSRQYLPLARVRLRADYDGRDDAEQVLVYVLRAVLSLMHPFMPFVTEEIWQALTDCESAVVTAEYPDYQSVLDFGQTADEFEHVLEALQAVRRSRKALHIPHNVRAKFFFDTLDIEIFSASSIFFEYLGGAKEIAFVSDCCFRNAIDVITDRARISIPLEQQLIQDREHMRLMEEAEHLRQKADRLKAMLHNAEFCAKAPESVVRETREQRAVIRERLLRIVTALGNRS